MDINTKLQSLRAKMHEKKIDAFLIPSNDPHQSEYVADHWKSRIWISGFTGSAGTVVVTKDHAGLWTDSRYFLQAEEQLSSSEFVLHKQSVPHAPEHIAWLLENLPENSVVACDGMLFSVGQVRNLNKPFYTKNIELDFDLDLISSIWKDRPALPQNTIFEHEVKFAGKSRNEKLTLIRKEILSKNARFYLITALDEIAWLFNIRSNDVECNPVSIGYAVVGLHVAYLFIDKQKVQEAFVTTLKSEGIFIKPYTSISSFLSNLKDQEPILVDPNTTSILLYNAIKDDLCINNKGIIASLKAIKNDIEIGHIKNAMIKDGVALTRLFRWLDAILADRNIPETEVAEKLIEFRRDQGDYHNESFDAIVGYNGNGAIVHYRAMPETCAKIKKEGILLLDSGGQYTDGTTDITRTIALGEPTTEQKRSFTLVLKGHINLATIKFPKGTKGIQLDTLARQHLWLHGLDYGHGTGHGVGFFLNVHEPPQGFVSTISLRGTTPFEPGMFTSNEPGFYKEGEYGIRIENLIIARLAEKNEFGQFMKFETLTLFPIDLNLVEESLLDKKEKKWLNDYHTEVLEKLSPFLDKDEKKWMEVKCRQI